MNETPVPDPRERELYAAFYRSKEDRSGVRGTGYLTGTQAAKRAYIRRTDAMALLIASPLFLELTDAEARALHGHAKARLFGLSEWVFADEFDAPPAVSPEIADAYRAARERAAQ